VLRREAEGLDAVALAHHRGHGATIERGDGLLEFHSRLSGKAPEHHIECAVRRGLPRTEVGKRTRTHALSRVRQRRLQSPDPIVNLRHIRRLLPQGSKLVQDAERVLSQCCKLPIAVRESGTERFDVLRRALLRFAFGLGHGVVFRVRD